MWIVVRRSSAVSDVLKSVYLAQTTTPQSVTENNFPPYLGVILLTWRCMILKFVSLLHDWIIAWICILIKWIVSGCIVLCFYNSVNISKMVPAHSESFIINKVFFSTVIQNYILKVDTFAFFADMTSSESYMCWKTLILILHSCFLSRFVGLEGSMRKFGC